MKTYKAARTIRPNVKLDLIKIIVREGESEFAKRNRYVGELIIDGTMIQRTIPENEKIDIVLTVDKDKSPKVSAYIECIDKKLKILLSIRYLQNPMLIYL